MGKDNLGSVGKHIEKITEVYEQKQEVEKEKEKENKSAFDLLTNNTVDEMDVKTVKQSAFEEGMKQLFSSDNLQMKTELSAPLILAMARGRIFADTYNSKKMNTFIDYIQVLNVSKGRKGRQELVSLVRNSQDVEEMDSGMTGISKLMGIGKG